MKKTIYILFTLIFVLAAVSGAGAENKLIADTGFRVGTDGFGFENYGAQVCEGGSAANYFFPSNSSGSCYKVTNLTSAEMVRMYGSQVCKNGSVNSDGTCTLTKTAESWMKQINQVVTNGHCEGMAVLSSLFYSGIENPADFGNKNVNKLTLKGNTKLQREIAYWFTTQWFMDKYLIENDPTTQLKYLKNAFDKDPNTVIPLGIYQKNMSGGHAIAAYAIVEKGNGIYYIMVYDNNYPNEERYITVDTNKNTWSYTASSNPWSTAGNYSGQGNSNRFQIAPIAPRLGTFDCDFCTQQSSYSPFSPSTPSYPDSSDYSDIWDILSPWMNPDPSDSYTPSSPSSPSAPSDSYSIWDILSPWMFPDSSPSSPSSPSAPNDYYDIPTATPQGGQSYPESSDIWDILSPWLNPGSPSGQPTTAPESNDIWDVLAPYLTPGSSSSDSSDSWGLPTATPSWQDISDSSQDPVKRPTTVPAPGREKYNRITVNSAINIYIEDDNDERSGYDWEQEEYYDEIEGVEIKRSMGRSSAKLPKGLKYYLWMNSPDEKEWTTFDATITSPGRVLNLTNIPEAYGYPNFVYSPPTYVKSLGFEFEFFEIMAYADELPGVEFVINDEEGEYSFRFDTELIAKKKKTAAVPKDQIDFAIFHNYDSGEVGIWISAVDDAAADEFRNFKFSVNGEFTSWDKDNNETVVKTKSPIQMSINGMFYLDYRDWKPGTGLPIEADLDGDQEYETTKEL